MDDALGGGFREIARGSSSGSLVRPLLGLVGGVLLSAFAAYLALASLSSLFVEGPVRSGRGIDPPPAITAVFGILMLVAAPVLAVMAIRRFPQMRRARERSADLADLSVVEGPLEYRSGSGGSDHVVVGGTPLELDSIGGPVRQFRLVRALKGPTVGYLARAWFVPGDDMVEPVLVRLAVRDRSGAELLQELDGIERQHAGASPHHAAFLAELPAMRAGFAPDATVAARTAALQRLEHFRTVLRHRRA